MEDKQKNFPDEDIQKLLKMLRRDICKKCLSANTQIINDEYYTECGAEVHKVTYECNDCGVTWCILECGAFNPRLLYEKYVVPINSDFAITFG